MLRCGIGRYRQESLELKEGWLLTRRSNKRTSTIHQLAAYRHRMRRLAQQSGPRRQVDGFVGRLQGGSKRFRRVAGKTLCAAVSRSCLTPFACRNPSVSIFRSVAKGEFDSDVPASAEDERICAWGTGSNSGTCEQGLSPKSGEATSVSKHHGICRTLVRVSHGEGALQWALTCTYRLHSPPKCRVDP